MKISTGTISFKTQFQLQFRSFLVPWVEKKSVIKCLKKNRDYSSSSGPVRYIPKKSDRAKISESLNSEKVKILKRKDLTEFSEANPPLENEVGYGGNFVQNEFDFDVKTSFRSQIPNNLHHEVVEQKEPKEFSKDDNVMEEPRELRIQYGRDVFEPFDNKTKKNITEKFPSRYIEVSLGGNAQPKSFDFDTKPRNRSQMLANNVPFNDEERGTIMDELEGVSDNEDLLEEREDELDEEPLTELSCHGKNKIYDRVVLKARENTATPDAEKAAVKLLAKRAFTTVELKKKLHGMGFSTDIVEPIINDFKSRGLLNDSWFAEAFCQSRWSSSTWGPRRIKQELSRKRVSKEDTDNAIGVVFRGAKIDEQHEPSQRLSQASMDRLLAQASKQWQRGHDVPKETRKSRIIRWLLYRGFNWDVIRIIVKKLESNQRP